MSFIVIEAVSQNKTGIKVGGQWMQVSPQVGNFVKVGSSYLIEQRDQNNVITRVKPQQGGGNRGGQGGGKSGYQSAPKQDNTIGMAIGAAVNCATALHCHGVISEENIPAAVAAIYKLSEEGKKLVAAGNVDGLLSYQFSLGGYTEQQEHQQQQYTPPQYQQPQQQANDDTPPWEL